MRKIVTAAYSPFIFTREGECGGSGSDLFANAKGHYNPNNCPHPYHAGHRPPLIGNNGYAYMSVLSDRFTARERL